MNDIVIDALGIVFGIWLINSMIDCLFGIDIIETIRKWVTKER